MNNMIEHVLSDTKIIHYDSINAEKIDTIVKYCGGEKANLCIIIDNQPLPSRDILINELKKIREVVVMNKVFPDPKVSDIMDMVNDLRNKNINIILGIGGGSTLDSAKGVAAILSNGGDLEDYLGASATRQVTKKNIKLILMPTTAGTGSEVTKFGVYTSTSGRKYTLNNPVLQADIAILDPQLTCSLPPELTAATAFDALSHALETLWNKNATFITDMAATESAVYILKWMEKAYESSLTGSNERREEMLIGACKAGIAFNQTGTAIVHALSFVLGEEWKIPHGIACAFTLEDALELNSQDSNTKEKLIAIADELFKNEIHYENISKDEKVDKLKNYIVKLKVRLKLPLSLKDLNIDLKEEKIGEIFNKSLEDPKMKNNAVFVDEEMIYGIIKNKL